MSIILAIIGHERYKGHWNERLQIILEIYHRLNASLKRQAISLVYEIAKNEPKTSKVWRQANEFLAHLVDVGGDDSELARKHWQKLGSVA